MKKYFLLPVVLITILINACSNEGTSYGIYSDKVDLCFTPSMQCMPLIHKTLQNAQESIYVHTYTLTSKSIAKALLDAYKRGIKVEIIADPGQSKTRYSQIPFLRESGIPIWIDYQISGLHHNKIMIIDQSTLICGSYNFTEAAEKRNAENLLIIYSPQIAQQYLNNWKNNLARIQGNK